MANPKTIAQRILRLAIKPLTIAAGVDAEISKQRSQILSERNRVKAALQERDQSRRDIGAARNEALREVKELRARESAYQNTLHADVLTDFIDDGLTFDEAFVHYLQVSQSYKEASKARAFAHALVEDPKHAALGHLGLGIWALSDELPETALDHFKAAGVERALALCPVSYFLALCGSDSDLGVTELVKFLESKRVALSPSDHLGLIQVLAKHHAFDQFNQELPYLVERRIAGGQFGETDASLIDWYVRQMADFRKPARHIPDGAISVAIMDYKLLDLSRTSSNRGDYVQTLAGLANLCRFTQVDFVGEDELSNLLTELQSDIAPARKIGDITARVVPVALDRDFSHGREYPDNTWLICNGWFMHRNYKGDMDFPFPDSVNPIFMSFHVNNPDVLNETVAEQLKKYEPIGCRDWTTVYRLRDFGVQAFFSGCLTSTVGQILPSASTEADKKLAVVETRYSEEDFSGWTVERFSQEGEHVKHFTLTEGILDAKLMLTEYSAFSKIVTSRLHCYLPTRSMGHDVDFTPRNLADIRFEGLIELDDQAFNTMRSGIETKLEIVWRAILSGKSQDEVMAIWREVCSPDVAFAARYCDTFEPLMKTGFNVQGVISHTAEHVKHQGRTAQPDDIQLAFALDQNLKDELLVVLRSIAQNTQRPIHAHVLCRGLDDNYLNRIVAQQPEMAFSFYAFDDVNYGDTTRMLSHTTVSTLDRLFLPEILKEYDKVLYLDIDILVCSDVAELYDLDVSNYAIGARFSALPSWRNLERLTTWASMHMQHHMSWQLRKWLHKNVDMTAVGFNAGVLLLNLSDMRSRNFTEQYLPLVEHYAFNDQDALNVYAAGRVLSVPNEWNYIPNLDFSDNPKIIHWAGPNKPWKKQYVQHRNKFRDVRKELLGY